MRLQLSTSSDITNILQIINDAKVYLKSKEIDQWQHGYPNKSQIEKDIANNESYVLNVFCSVNLLKKQNNINS